MFLPRLLGLAMHGNVDQDYPIWATVLHYLGISKQTSMGYMLCHVISL